jgi:hypothetical protein
MLHPEEYMAGSAGGRQYARLPDRRRP